MERTPSRRATEGSDQPHVDDASGGGRHGDHRTYFFDAAASPNAFWVPLADLDLKSGAPVIKLPLAGGGTYSGGAAGDFVAAAPFAFFAAPTD